MQVSGKTAVITGGTSGLGEAAARHLYSLGANIVIADLNDERGQQLKSELGHKAIYVKTDVSSSEASRALGQAAVDKFGAVHILVNSAGIGTIARIIGKKGPMDVNIFKKTIDVNLIGTFNCMSNLAWEMSKNETVENGERGVIINVASIAGFEGQIGQIAYAASKAGIIGMTITAARDLSSHGIRVCTIAPGTFLTPMIGLLSEEVRESLGKQVPFPPRLGKVSEFAALVQHIVENAYLNGETIRLDGAIRMGIR
jgi:3-hydroxyacyl-CoA dehydrogenase/3-hydroxy-2-methylbutyryl-CoA dehydrogenase